MNARAPRRRRRSRTSAPNSDANFDRYEKVAGDRHAVLANAVKRPGEQRSRLLKRRRAVGDRMRSNRLQTYHWLKRVLPEQGVQELVDLLSGLSASTVPLVADGVLDRLTVVDSDRRYYGPAVKAGIADLGVSDRVRQILGTIDSSFSLDDGSLPSTGALLGTGLMLPEAYKRKPAFSSHKRADYTRDQVRDLVTPYVEGSPITMDTLLSLFEQRGEGRLYVMEEATSLAPPGIERASREHIEQILATYQGGDWDIDEWAGSERHRMVFGVLNLR